MNFWLSSHEWSILQSDGTTAHGVYSSGLFRIDRYGEEILISRYCQEDISPLLSEFDLWCGEMSYSPQRIFLKDLVKNPTAESLPELIKGTASESPSIVEERGLSFQVDLMGGYSTGLFIDQRMNRKALGELKPKQVLNCFAYTCAFSVAGASAGASTTSIDLAGKSLERGKRNFEINNIPLSGHYFIADDVRAVLPRLHRKGLRFDAIILDPPTFARSKKGAPFKVEKEYPGLIDMALDCATEDASILLSTNSRDLSSEDLILCAEKCLKARGIRGQFENVERPPDIAEMDMPSTVWLKLV